MLAIRQLAYEAHRKGQKAGIIATNETMPFYTYGLVKNLGSRENEKAIARNLYAVLREFDEEEVSVIFSESFAAQGIGKAIMNRLEKAAGHVMLPAAADREAAEIQTHRILKQYRYKQRPHGSGTSALPGSGTGVRHRFQGAYRTVS